MNNFVNFDHINNFDYLDNFDNFDNIKIDVRISDAFLKN